MRTVSSRQSGMFSYQHSFCNSAGLKGASLASSGNWKPAKVGNLAETRWITLQKKDASNQTGTRVIGLARGCTREAYN